MSTVQPAEGKARAEELGLSDETLLAMYRRMNEIRRFEETIYRLYMDGKLPGFMHVSIGQEAVPVGTCTALRTDDYITSTHRGHGDTIAKGVDVKAAMAELWGRSTGACRSKGGSMHITDVSKGILGANGIVSAGMPIATGAALSARRRGTDQVVVCFFGDGAFAEGNMHECLNIANLWKLPVIFVRQNNYYAESNPWRNYQGVPDIVDWAASYGMPATRVDGNTVLDVYEAAKKAVERARRGEGPSFIESETYRWYGHNIGDPGTWRPAEEIEAWKAKDPLKRFREYVIGSGVANAETLDAIEAEAAQLIKDAVAEAEAAPLSPPEEALEGVYSDPTYGPMAIEGSR